jgi:Fe-S-cluster-containing dehydrogenase component
MHWGMVIDLKLCIGLTKAIIFGDLDDPQSEVSLALAEPRVRLRLREELGTRPSIYYLT